MPSSLTRQERDALRAFYDVYRAVTDDVNGALARQAASIPSFQEAIASAARDPEAAAEAQRASQERIRRAIVEEDWGPLLENLRLEGRRYADAGVPLVDWYDLTRMFRRIMLEHIHRHFAAGGPLVEAIEGLTLYQDIALRELAAAYLGSPATPA